MIDETSDISIKEQVSVCIRTVENKDLSVNEYFMGVYETHDTTAERLHEIVKDILSRFALPINKCRGQCYDGASSVSGRISGLQTRIKSEESRAIFVHCTAHTLNLVVQDAMKNIPVGQDFLAIMRELITFVRNSPKRIAIFNMLQNDDENNVVGKNKLRPFCPTRWCLRITSLCTLVTNYGTLLEFLNNFSKEKNDVGYKASGFLKTLLEFESMFLFELMINVFQKIETLNGTLQKSSLHLQNVVNYVQILKQSLQQQRDNDYELLWSNTLRKCYNLEIEEPVLPRKRKLPKRLDEEFASTSHSFQTPKDMFRQLFYEVIDYVLSSLNCRFQNETMNHLIEVEKFAIGLADSTYVMKFYGSDFDEKSQKSAPMTVSAVLPHICNPAFLQTP